MIDVSSKIPEYVSAIIKQLKSAGFEAYIVGGCIRDILLGRYPGDWDVCTSALPDEVTDTLCGYKVIKTGIAHGTVTAIKNKDICEITTFRCDGKYADHRRPDNVVFTRSLRDDLARRDFSVNAMAFSEETGIVDLYNGQQDLKNRTIRCVGIPETRFTEDSLRILRALRFSSVLNFQIEPSTAQAMFLCSDLIAFVAKERIYQELKKLLCGSSAYRILQDYKSIIFKFLNCSELENNAHFLRNATQEFSLRYALLFYNASIDVALHNLSNLKADKKTINEVEFLIKNNSKNHFLDSQSIKKTLSSFGKEKTKKLFDYVSITHNFPENKKCNIQTLIEELPVITLKELEINGNDIINLGFKKGVEIKKILNLALNAVLQNNCKNEKTVLIEFILREKKKVTN